MSPAAAGSSASTVTTAPTGTAASRRASAITGSGQRWPRQSSSRHGPRHRPTTPSRPAGRPRFPAARPGTGPRPPRSCPRCSDTRTLPCDSTPIASSTWLGRSVDAVHDEPDETANPRRSSACSSASPSTYRQENVTRCGSRSTGSPTTSTSGTVAATVGADPVDQRAQPRRLRRPPRPRAARSAAAAATTRGSDAGPGSGSGGVEPHALAHRQHAHAGRPAPLAGARRQQRPAGRHGHPPDRLGRVDQQRHAGGGARPRGRGDRLHRAHLVVGAHQRGGRDARRGDGGAERVRVDPAEPVHRYGTASPPVAACARAALSTAECSTAEWTKTRPARAPPGQQAGDGPVARLGAAGGEVQLVRPYPEHLGVGGARPRRAAGGPGGPARRACPGRPSRRPARRPAPAARPDAAARPWPRRGSRSPRRPTVSPARASPGTARSTADTPTPRPARGRGRVICDRRRPPVTSRP